MGSINYITIAETKPRGSHTVTVSLLHLSRKLGQHFEDHYKIVGDREQWLREAIGGVTFQADYVNQIAYFHFENPYSAMEFKIRWG